LGSGALPLLQKVAVERLFLVSILMIIEDKVEQSEIFF
jgi:hypothetical protein